MKIFTLTVYTKDGKDHRTWGYLPSLEEARNSVEKNYAGMDDNLFRYLVIEEISPGIAAMAKVCEWYIYDYTVEQEWVKCEAPEWALHSYGFSMG